MHLFIIYIHLITDIIADIEHNFQCAPGLSGNRFCPINGGWTSWNSWSPCTGECGSIGKKIRNRSCSNPPPSDKGAPCIGRNTQIANCHVTGCMLDAFKEVVRKDPIRKEEMKMVNAVHERIPALMELCFSANCGYPIIEKILGTDAMVYWNAMNCVKYGVGCPNFVSVVAGGWSSWKPWSSCSAPCGKGQIYRERFCNNPTPSDLELTCDGLHFEIDDCTGIHCKIELSGTWSNWGSWSACNVQCGTGTKVRMRTCTEYQERYTKKKRSMGTSCEGPIKQIDACTIKDCSIDGVWSQWTMWTACSSECGVGMQSRNRMCNNPSPRGKGATCFGSATEVHQCFTKPCSVRSHEVAYFSGESSIVYPASGKDYHLLHMYIRFLPLTLFGTLVYRYANDDFVKLFLQDGRIIFMSKIADCTMIITYENRIEIGQWHEILAEVCGSYGLIHINKDVHKIAQFSCIPFLPNLDHKMIIGDRFHGQVEKITINFKPIQFRLGARSFGIETSPFINKHTEYVIADDEEGFVHVAATESIIAPCPEKVNSWHIVLTLKPADVDGAIAMMLGNIIPSCMLLALEDGRAKLDFWHGNLHVTAENTENTLIKEWVEIVIAKEGKSIYVQVNGDKKHYFPSIFDDTAVTCANNFFIGAAPNEAKKRRCFMLVEVPQMNFILGLLKIDGYEMDLLSLPVQEMTSGRFSSRTISSSDNYEEVLLALGQELKLSCFYDRIGQKVYPPTVGERFIMWLMVDKPICTDNEKGNIYALEDDGHISTLTAASYFARETIEGFYSCRLKYFYNDTIHKLGQMLFSFGIVVTDENIELVNIFCRPWTFIMCTMVILLLLLTLWVLCEGIWDYRIGYGFYRLATTTEITDLDSIAEFLTTTDALVLLGSQEAALLQRKHYAEVIKKNQRKAFIS